MREQFNIYYGGERSFAPTIVSFDHASHKISMDTTLMERQHEYVGTSDWTWVVGFYFIFNGYRGLKPSMLTSYNKYFIWFEK